MAFIAFLGFNNTRKKGTIKNTREIYLILRFTQTIITQTMKNKYWIVDEQDIHKKGQILKLK